MGYVKSKIDVFFSMDDINKRYKKFLLLLLFKKSLGNICIYTHNLCGQKDRQHALPVITNLPIAPW